MRRLLLSLLLLFVAIPAWAKTTIIEVGSIGNRRVPVTIITPDRGKATGIILFSHGALSSPAKYGALTGPWSKRGYIIIAPLHADSTDWKGAKPAMLDQTAWRMADMAAAIAALPTFAQLANFKIVKQPLYAAGHSFGGLIAMKIDDPRIVSIIAFSPPGPVPGLTIPVVTKPMLTVTGTADSNPMMAPKWEAHLTAHNMATGPAWAYVGTGADHYFGGIYCRPELPGPKQTAPFQDALMLSNLFLDETAQPTNAVKLAALRAVFAAFGSDNGAVMAKQ